MRKLPQILLAITLVLLCLAVMDIRYLQGLLTKASATVEKQNQTIAEQNARLLAISENAALKTLPLKFGHRTAMTGDGGVVLVENSGNEILEVKMTVKRGNQNKQFDLVMNPNIQKAIGYQEGWTFISGDDVEFQSNGYRSIRAKYP